MDRACITHEVQAGPRETGKELDWKQVSLEPIATRTSRHEVPGRVRTAVADGLDVIERGGFERERLCAIHTATAAVAHRRLLYSALSFCMSMTRWNPVWALPAGAAWKTVC
jgi:hypothetical protein